MSSRRSERPRKRPTPIDAHYDTASSSSALLSAASTVTAATAVTARVIKSGRGRKRPAAGEEPVGGDDMPVQDVGDGDVPRGSAEPENPDEEEEEDPVWQEFSQEYYEVVEQLPLEIHRNFALLRELDDQTQRQTGQLLELIRKYVVGRLPSPVPKELEVPQQGPGVGDGAEQEVKEEEGASGTGDVDGAGGERVGGGVELLGDSMQDSVQDSVQGTAQDSAQDSAIQGTPAQGATEATVQSPTLDSKPTPPLAHAPPHDTPSAHPAPPAPPSTHRIAALKSRHAEIYAHRLVPAMASRDLLPSIGKLARDMLRSADEKVGIAIGTYNTVDRHIRSLDAALQAQQAALNLGIRQDTLPSAAVTGAGAGEEPSTTLQAGGKADAPSGVRDLPPDGERRGKDPRKGVKDAEAVRAVDALNVGPMTTGKKRRTTEGKVVGEPEPEPIVLGYMAAHNFDLAIDPNEPRYCFCQNVSYGEMVGCENLDCPNGGWFHLGCLGMTSAPQGKWWCDQCRPKDKASGQKRKKRTKF